MKEIKLTQGKFALVDDEDFEWLNRFRWFAYKMSNTFYAGRTKRKIDNKRTTLFMHRFILNISERAKEVDHIDHNGLNNQRNNLRIATPAQNRVNKSPKKNGISKYLGVSYNKKNKKWIAKSMKNGIEVYLGSFNIEDEAAIAYNVAATKHHGEFANLNIIE